MRRLIKAPIWRQAWELFGPMELVTLVLFMATLMVWAVTLASVR